jgi:LysR family nitrogen assimilation transcriptional regulator
MPTRKRRSYKEASLSQFRSFCEVCRRGGYAAAARELMLTSPAVWEQMQALEYHYGMKLLERAGSGVRPTASGARLLELVRPLVAGFDSTREILQQEDGSLPRQLVFVTNLRVLVEEISGAMRAFQRRYPAIRLAVHYTAIDEIAPRVREGKTDLALTLEPEPSQPSPAESTYEPAGVLDYLLVMPPRHELARLDALHLRDIAKCPLVLGEMKAYSRRRVQEVFHRYDLASELNVAVETSSDEYTISCVRSGMGIGITLGIPRGRLYQGLKTRSLRRWFGMAGVGFLWQKGIHVAPVQREFARELQASYSR